MNNHKIIKYLNTSPQYLIEKIYKIISKDIKHVNTSAKLNLIDILQLRKIDTFSLLSIYNMYIFISSKRLQIKLY